MYASQVAFVQVAFFSNWPTHCRALVAKWTRAVCPIGTLRFMNRALAVSGEASNCSEAVSSRVAPEAYECLVSWR